MKNILSRRNFLASATVAAGAAPMMLAANAAAESASSSGEAVMDYAQPADEGALVIGSLDDLEEQAKQVLPAGAFAFIASGADNQVTLRANREELDRIRLLPQYLVGKPAPGHHHRIARTSAEHAYHHGPDGSAWPGS